MPVALTDSAIFMDCTTQEKEEHIILIENTDRAKDRWKFEAKECRADWKRLLAKRATRKVLLAEWVWAKKELRRWRRKFLARDTKKREEHAAQNTLNALANAGHIIADVPQPAPVLLPLGEASGPGEGKRGGLVLSKRVKREVEEVN